MLLSLDPTYTVPSGPSAGDDQTTPLVGYFHFRPPAGVIAWRLALHQDAGWARGTVYVLGTIALTVTAVVCFGRLEDRAARRRPVSG